jgi:PKD repeat protein
MSVVCISIGNDSSGALQIVSDTNVCMPIPATMPEGTAITGVVAGRTYYYSAGGMAAWDWPSGHSVSANGFYGIPGNSAFVCPGLAQMSLVGKLNGICIQLGTSGSFVAPATGELFLMMNDETAGFYNNGGVWDVCLTLPPDWMPAGLVGGPFDPSSRVYTLTNSGGTEFTWLIAADQNWITPATNTGTLAAGASTNITLLINTIANALNVGNYSNAVRFTNLTSGVGNTNCLVSLTVLPPGVLGVSPTSGFTSSGLVGGPFTPSSQIYALTNSGYAALEWQLGLNHVWLTCTPNSGGLPVGAGTNVTVTINANANNLPSGSYTDSVAFANLTDGSGNTSRAVSLTVNPIGILGVTPSMGFSSTGYVGGPFTPLSQTYTLTNSGDASLHWSAAHAQDWVGLSSTAGTLAVGATAILTVSINSNANTLAVGSYVDTVSITNATTGFGSSSRGVDLTVQHAPPLASFSGIPTNGPAPLSVSFTDTSMGTITNRYWDFGDGATADTASGSSVHVYKNAGMNTVGLTVSGPGGSSTTNRINYIIVTNTNALSDIVAWGCDNFGQADVPGGLTNLIAIAAGGFHNLALSANGSVTAWGYDGAGETDVPAGLTNAVAIAAGDYHSLALKADGSIVAWGWNEFGQCNVPADLTNAVSIAAGADHNLAIATDGTVTAWGDNEYGGINVPSNLTKVVAVAAGGFHSLALKPDGTVVGWGGDFVGQTDVPANLTNVVSIAAGGNHSLALKADGSVVAWGYNGNGQINVPPDLTDAVAVAGGSYHSLALKADGTVVVWGGQTNAPTGLSNATAIGAGSCHNLALVGDGSPIFTVQPWSRSVWGGTTVTLCAMAVGAPALNYQWRFNGTNILHATSTTLTLTNLQMANAGSYSVVASNAMGSVISRSAYLSVIPLDHFSFSAVPSPQIPGAPFVVTITARDAANEIFPAYPGTVALSCTSNLGSVSMSPANSGTFTAGQWTGSITIGGSATNVWLLAADGSGHSGASNPFAVQIGPVHHFSWGAVASPQGSRIPFDVTITAQDAGGNTVTSFTGFVSFAASGNGVFNTLEDFESGEWPHAPWVFLRSTGTVATAYAHDGNYGLSDPYWMYRTDVRLGDPGDRLSLWMRTPTNSNQLASAYLGFNASTTGCWAFVAAPNRGQILIQRIPGFLEAVSLGTAKQAWGSNKWYKAVVEFTSTVSVQCDLYDSDGITLLNSLSYTNSSALTGGVAMRSSGGWCLDSLEEGNGFLLAMTPDASGNFAGGTWTGSVSILQTATNVVLMASDAGHRGASGPFDVLDASVLQWLQWQMQFFSCTNCSQAAETADPDGDGFTNLQEFQAGTNPTNSASAFRIIDIWPEDDDMFITWTAVGGKRYILQTTTNLGGSLSNAFIDLNPAIVAWGTAETEVTVLHMGVVTNPGVRVYRVRLVP